MSVEQFIERGKVAHGEKRYSDAVKYFTNVLAISPHDLNSQQLAIDLRCQSYSKSGNQTAALHDAKRLIHLSNKRGHIGYLRCSQIERLSGNFVAARRWLDHGLKHVSTEHKVIFQMQIKKVEEYARLHHMERKRKDPIASTPLEILQLIFSYLTYREVTCLLRISKTWKNLLSRLPPLTTSVDFTDARRSISPQACKASFRRLCTQPQTLILRSTTLPATNYIISWMSKFINIESLEIIDISKIDVPLDRLRFDKLRKLQCLSLGPQQMISALQMLKIIHNCPSLEKIAIYLMPGIFTVPQAIYLRLRHLTLHSGKSSGLCSIESLDCFPSLQSLTLHGRLECRGLLDLSKLEYLKSLRLSQLAALTEIKLAQPAVLEELICESSASEIYAFSYPTNIPNLQKLVAGHQIQRDFLHQLEKSIQPPKLREIVLQCGDSSMLSAPGGTHWRLFATCTKVTFCSSILTDDDAPTFIANFPAVEDLTLEAPAITGVFVANLVGSYKSQLKHLTLKECGRVSSDIRQWLISQGIPNRILKVGEGKNMSRVRDAW